MSLLDRLLDRWNSRRAAAVDLPLIEARPVERIVHQPAPVAEPAPLAAPLAPAPVSMRVPGTDVLVVARRTPRAAAAPPLVAMGREVAARMDQCDGSASIELLQQLELVDTGTVRSIHDRILLVDGGTTPGNGQVLADLVVIERALADATQRVANLVRLNEVDELSDVMLAACDYLEAIDPDVPQPGEGYLPLTGGTVIGDVLIYGELRLPANTLPDNDVSDHVATTEWLARNIGAHVVTGLVAGPSIALDPPAGSPGTVTVSLAPTGVAAGLYGSNAMAVQLELNDRGQVTTVTELPIDPVAIGALATTILAPQSVAGDVDFLGKLANSGPIISNANDTTVATTAWVNTKLNAIGAGRNFQGAWNAATNTPPLASGVGTPGDYYIVDTPGTTDLDGNAAWEIGDEPIFGVDGKWHRIVSAITSESIEAALGYMPGRVDQVIGGTGIKVDDSDPARPTVNLTDTLGSGSSAGSATKIPVLTVDKQGRVTAIGEATATSIDPNAVQRTGDTMTGPLAVAYKGAGQAALELRSGDANNGSKNYAQIAFGYDGGGTYRHWVATRHDGAGGLKNAIDFYVGDGTSAGTFPANAKWSATLTERGLMLGKGAAGAPALSFTAAGPAAATGNLDTGLWSTDGESDINVSVNAAHVASFLSSGLILRTANSGVTFNGGARVYGHTDKPLTLLQGTSGASAGQPQIRNNDGTNARDIVDTANGEQYFVGISNENNIGGATGWQRICKWTGRVWLHFTIHKVFTNHVYVIGGEVWARGPQVGGGNGQGLTCLAMGAKGGAGGGGASPMTQLAIYRETDGSTSLCVNNTGTTGNMYVDWVRFWGGASITGIGGGAPTGTQQGVVNNPGDRIYVG